VTTIGSVKTNDLKAIVTIYRKDRNHPFEWEANYCECVQTTREGNVTKFWQKSIFMTKKVAISQAFRLCFSDELGGIPYDDSELPIQQTEDVTYTPVVEQPQQTTIIEPVKNPISDKTFNTGIERIKNGEVEIIEKIEANYSLTENQ
jgi:hypothetical protein